MTEWLRGTEHRLALIAGLSAALLAAAVVAVVALAGGGSGDAPGVRSSTAGLRVDRFDSGRAWAELKRQVALGPRPAGSRALRRLSERLRRELPDGRFEPVPGHRGLRNVVGRLPGAKPAIVIAAHYDTKALPGFVGANDGAAGTAAVLELARALGRTDRPPDAPELRFVLFDGEEATDDARAFTATGLRPPDELDGLSRTVSDKPGKEHFYDQIAWFTGDGGVPALTLQYTGAAGGFDFVPHLMTTLSRNELSWRISDHYPLWAEFVSQ